MTRLPKILLLGDYSNCHYSLATGLRQLGCDVTLISDGSRWQGCKRDIDISRRPGKIGGLRLFTRLKWGLHRYLRGYDVVILNDPNFVELRPKLLRSIFDRLKKENGAVMLNLMSTDNKLLDMYEAKDCPLKYSEWFIQGEPAPFLKAHPEKWMSWRSAELRAYHNYVYDSIDGAFGVLYEYYKSLERVLPPDKICYTGLPIITENFEPVRMAENPDKVKLFLGRTRGRELFKGVDLLEKAAVTVAGRYPGRVELETVENIPFDDFISRMKKSHIVLDQIYSYTPATTALMAMAYGLNVVSGGEEDYYRFIGETDNHPIINAPVNLDELTETLDGIVTNPAELAERGRKSRSFVIKHNDCRVVAKRYLDFIMR